MFMIPDGTNAQIVPWIRKRPRDESTNDPSVYLSSPTEEGPSSSTMTSASSALMALKDIAPHLNRKERRQHLARIAREAKAKTVELARQEMKKQQKEKARG